jgi:hypothetical protein
MTDNIEKKNSGLQDKINKTDEIKKRDEIEKRKEILALILGNALLEKKLLEKFWKNFNSETQALKASKQKLSDKASRHQFVQMKFDKTDTANHKIKCLVDITKSPIEEKAFNQALFDVYYATLIKNNFGESHIENIIEAEKKLNVSGPSKFATQHTTKAARKKEVALLMEYYKGKVIKREDVIRIINLQDFNKQPRSLSGLHLEDGCDLTGLDLRKIKFEQTVMNKVKIDGNTKFKGSTFHGTSINSIQIGETIYDTESLRDDICTKYSEARERKINSYAKFTLFGHSPIKSIAEKLVSNAPKDLKAEKKASDSLMRLIERSEHNINGRTNKSYGPSLDNEKNHDHSAVIDEIEKLGVVTTINPW